MKHETQDSLTENAIKAERFYKKYKSLFYGLILILFLAASGTYIYKAMAAKAVVRQNELYLEVLKDKSEEKLAELKKANINLYTLALLELNKEKDFKELAKDTNMNELLNQLVRYKAGESSIFLKDYSFALKGFLFLEKKDFKSAKLEFDKIKPSSDLYMLVKSLKHYQVEK